MEFCSKFAACAMHTLADSQDAEHPPSQAVTASRQMGCRAGCGAPAGSAMNISLVILFFCAAETHRSPPIKKRATSSLGNQTYSTDKLILQSGVIQPGTAEPSVSACIVCVPVHVLVRNSELASSAADASSTVALHVSISFASPLGSISAGLPSWDLAWMLHSFFPSLSAR